MIFALTVSGGESDERITPSTALPRNVIPATKIPVSEFSDLLGGQGVDPKNDLTDAVGRPGYGRQLAHSRHQGQTKKPHDCRAASGRQEGWPVVYKPAISASLFNSSGTPSSERTPE